MIKGILKILILHTNYSSKIYVQTIVWGNANDRNLIAGTRLYNE